MSVKLSARLTEIFSLIPNCEIFADIACDHGYIAAAMLIKNKCNKAIFSDISEKCLLKAQNLLKPFVENKKAIGLVSDGFEKIEFCDVALIAGIGGEEILEILKKSKFLPNTLILQPMKNSSKIRQFLDQKKYEIVKDYTFFADQVFYDVILAKKEVGKTNTPLTEEQIYFGKTNLEEKPLAFINKLKIEKKQIEKFLTSNSLSEKSRKELEEKLKRLQKYV